MAVNPYLNPDDDEDLLGDNAGSSKKQGPIVEFRGPNGEHLPDHLQSALAEYFQDYNTVSSENAVPGIFRAIAGMYDYFYDITRYKEFGPLLAAMAELVNEYSDGRLMLIYQLKESQRKIAAIHQVKRQINIFLTGATVDEMNDIKAEMMTYFETLASLCDFVQNKATSLYYDLCAKLEQEPDKELVESGYYTNRDTITRVSFGNPPARNDIE